MKRVMTILAALLLLMSSLPLSGCNSLDTDGEWGAYYAAFQVYAKEMKSDTLHLCVDNSEIEEENKQKLYDLFYEYCKENKMTLAEGDWIALYASQQLTDSSEYEKGYLVTFMDAIWTEDRAQVTLTVSLKSSATAGENNLGGTVTVTKKNGEWQAVKTAAEKDETGKAGAYCKVFDYFVKQAGMSGLKTLLVLDPGGVETDVLAELRTLLTSRAGKQGYSYRECDWETLISENLVDSSGDFSDGYYLSYSDVKWNDSLTQLEITCWMKDGNLRGLGGVFTVSRQDTDWVITNVKTMMS